MKKLLVAISMIATAQPALAINFSWEAIFKLKPRVFRLGKNTIVDLGRVSQYPVDQAHFSPNGVRYLDLLEYKPGSLTTYNHVYVKNEQLHVAQFKVLPPRGADLKQGTNYHRLEKDGTEVRAYYTSATTGSEIEMKQSFEELQTEFSTYGRVKRNEQSNNAGKSMVSELNPSENVAFNVQVSGKVFSKEAKDVNISVSNTEAKKMFGEDAEVLKIDLPADLSPESEITVITVKPGEKRDIVERQYYVLAEEDGKYSLKQTRTAERVAADEIEKLRALTADYKVMQREKIDLMPAEERSPRYDFEDQGHQPPRDATAE